MVGNTVLLFNNATEKQDLKLLKSIYTVCSNEEDVCFEYAKALLKSADINNNEIGKKILYDLIENNNSYYAMLELGNYEYNNDNIDMAIFWYKMVLKDVTNYVVIYKLASMYLEKKDYESFAYLIFENEEILCNHSCDRYILCLLYIYKKLGIFSNRIKMPVLTYSHHQLVDYNEKKAINHILKHKKVDEGGNSITVFNKKYKPKKIKKIFYDSKEQILEMKQSYNCFNSVYTIPYKDIGNNGEDYLRVVTLFDTKDILTMFPVPNKELEYNDVRRLCLKKIDKKISKINFGGRNGKRSINI